MKYWIYPLECNVNIGKPQRVELKFELKYTYVKRHTAKVGESERKRRSVLSESSVNNYSCIWIK